jgi:hypothetical protein
VKGKQFSIQPPKDTSGGVGYFSKMTYTDGEPFKDKAGATAARARARKRGVSERCLTARVSWTRVLEDGAA